MQACLFLIMPQTVLGLPPRPSDEALRSWASEPWAAYSSPCVSYPVCENVTWAPEKKLIQKSSSPLCLSGVSLPYSKPHHSLSLPHPTPQGHPSILWATIYPVQETPALFSSRSLRKRKNEPADVSAEPPFSPPLGQAALTTLRASSSSCLLLSLVVPLLSRSQRLSAHVRSIATSLSRIEAE